MLNIIRGIATYIFFLSLFYILCGLILRTMNIRYLRFFSFLCSMVITYNLIKVNF